MELDKKVFGNITIKEIIGASPPAIPETKNLFDEELNHLICKLESKTKADLKKLLVNQNLAEKLVNSRPGAMALAQDKIRLFTNYNQKYIQLIKNRLDS